MKIAIIRPSDLKHRVRGTGFYFENLKTALLKYHPENDYYFGDSKQIPDDADLVHFPFFEPFFLSLPIAPRRKTVVTVHDLTPLVFPSHFPAGIRGKIKWRIQKSALKKASAIITDSESSKKDIAQFTKIKDKVHVVYLAASSHFRQIKNSRKAQELKIKYKLPDQFALYVGDATWNKNLPRIAQAIKKSAVPLVLVGKAISQTDFDRSNPWNQDLVRVQKEIENDKLFIRTGFVEDEDLSLLYNLGTFLMMPSIYEGFGLPILEAMQSGCPVLTSKRGSIEEVAGEAALYVDPDSVDSIADGIVKLFNDKNLQHDLSEKGLRRAEYFSWKKTADLTMKVYEQVAKNP